MRRKTALIKVVAILVVVSFLCTDMAWAGGNGKTYIPGQNRDTLAAPERVAETAMVAAPSIESAELLSALRKIGVSSMADLVGKDIVKKGILKGKPCLIVSSNNKEGEIVYYFFDKEKRYYTRAVTDEGVTDIVSELLRLLDKNNKSVKGETIPIQIEGVTYYETQYSTVTEQKPAIQSFLGLFYEEAVELPAGPITKAYPDSSGVGVYYDSSVEAEAPKDGQDVASVRADIERRTLPVKKPGERGMSDKSFLIIVTISIFSILAGFSVDLANIGHPLLEKIVARIILGTLWIGVLANVVRYVKDLGELEKDWERIKNISPEFLKIIGSLTCCAIILAGVFFFGLGTIRIFGLGMLFAVFISVAAGLSSNYVEKRIKNKEGGSRVGQRGYSYNMLYVYFLGVFALFVAMFADKKITQLVFLGIGIVAIAAGIIYERVRKAKSAMGKAPAVVLVAKETASETDEELIRKLASQDYRVVNSASHELGKRGYGYVFYNKRAEAFAMLENPLEVQASDFRDYSGTGTVPTKVVWMGRKSKTGNEEIARLVSALKSSDESVVKYAVSRLYGVWGKHTFYDEETAAATLVSYETVFVSEFEDGLKTGEKTAYIGDLPKDEKSLVEVLKERLKSENPNIVSAVTEKLDELEYGLIQVSLTKVSGRQEQEGLISPVIINISQFNEEGAKTGEIPMWIGKDPLKDSNLIAVMIKRLASKKQELAKEAERSLTFFLRYTLTAEKPAGLINPRPVQAAQFDSSGKFKKLKDMWITETENTYVILANRISNLRGYAKEESSEELKRLGWGIAENEEDAKTKLVNYKQIFITSLGYVFLGFRLDYLLGRLNDKEKEVVDEVTQKLIDAGYVLAKTEEDAVLAILNPARVWRSTFFDNGDYHEQEEIYYGKPIPEDEKIEVLINALSHNNSKVVIRAKRILKERDFRFRTNEKDALTELEDAKKVNVTQFDDSGKAIGEYQIWIGKKSNLTKSLILALLSEKKKIVERAIARLRKMGFSFGNKQAELYESMPVSICQFDKHDRKTGVKEILMGKPLKDLVDKLESRDAETVWGIMEKLEELGYSFRDAEEDVLLIGMTNPIDVVASQFNSRGEWTSEKLMRMGKLSSDSKLSSYTRLIKEGKEEEIANVSLSHEGELGELKKKEGADLVKLAGILNVDIDCALTQAQIILREEVKAIRENPEYGIGIYGAVTEVVLVDNLGGLESRPKILKGPNAKLRKGKLYIDIDALRNRAVLRDTLKHELWHSVLEIVEKNTGIQEVTAVLKNLKEFTEMSDSEKDALIAFLNQENNVNGLDSKEYAKILQYVKDNKTEGDALVVLAINYVAGTERYMDLWGDLKNVLSSDVELASKKLQLAIDIYDELIRALTGERIEQAVKEFEPAIQKVKISERKTKAGVKTRMIMSEVKTKGEYFVTDLLEKGNFIKLYAEDLEQSQYIIDWLGKILIGKDKSPFIISSREDNSAKREKAVTAFLERHGIMQAQVPSGIDGKKIIDARDLGFALEKGLAKDNLSLPFIYSISGIYLAGKVVLYGGDISLLKEKDPLSYNSLMAMYASWFGETFTEDLLKQIIFGTWPGVLKLVENIDTLRQAIAKIEIAA